MSAPQTLQFTQEGQRLNMLDVNAIIVDAAIGASKRTRQVLLISQIFGLAFLIVYLNTQVTDWSSQRRGVYIHIADIYAECPESLQELGFVDHYHGSSPGHLWLPPDSSDLRKTISANKGAINNCAARVQWGKPDDVAGLLEYAAKTNTRSADVEKYLTYVESFEKDNAYSVGVPWAGLRIDINDFGLVAGSLHGCILMWLIMSIRRETASLRLISAQLRDQAPAAIRGVLAHAFFIGRVFGELELNDRPDSQPVTRTAAWTWSIIMLVSLVASGFVFWLCPSSCSWIPAVGLLLCTMGAHVALNLTITRTFWDAGRWVPIGAALFLPVSVLYAFACSDLASAHDYAAFGANVRNVCIGEIVLALFNLALASWAATELLKGAKQRPKVGGSSQTEVKA